MLAPRLRVNVVLPARDAEATLPALLEAMAGRDVRALVVVNRGSTDGTAGLARNRGAVVLRAAGGGYGQACQRALAHFADCPSRPMSSRSCPATPTWPRAISAGRAPGQRRRRAEPSRSATAAARCATRS